MSRMFLMFKCITPIRLMFLWLWILTALYFYWPMVEAEGIRAEIYHLREDFHRHSHNVHGAGPVSYGQPENKKYFKQGVWMRRGK